MSVSGQTDGASATQALLVFFSARQRPSEVLVEFGLLFCTRTVFAGAKQNNKEQERAFNVQVTRMEENYFARRAGAPPRSYSARLWRALHSTGKVYTRCLEQLQKSFYLKTARSSYCSRLLIRSSFQRGNNVHDNSGIVAWSRGVVQIPAPYAEA